MTTAAIEPPAGAPADGADTRVPGRWLILAVLCLAQVTVVLDNTVLTVAIPVLTTELAASTADVQWMINAYALVQCGLLLSAGSAADRYGRRRMLLAGLVLFGLGSLAAGLAQSGGQLIAARAGMGIGGALLVTATLAVAMQVFDDAERSRAIGLWAAASALGFAAGPPFGGLVLAHLPWGAIFLVNVPIVLVCLVAAWVLVPESRQPAGGRLDLGGVLLSTAGLTGVVYAIIAGPEHGWLATPVLGAAVAGVLLLAAFVVWERRTADPMLDMHFFRNPRFVGAVSGVVLITFGATGALFLLTQHLQFVRGYPAWEAGLRMMPFALSIVLLNVGGVAARVIRRLGLAWSIALGMTLLAGGLTLITHAPSDGYGVLLPGLLVMGAGCAVANPAIVEAVMSAIPPEKAGAGAGVDGTMTEVGSSLGIAVLGAILNARFAALLPAALAGAGSFPAALAAARSESERAIVSDSFRSALETGQTVGALAVFAGGCVAAALLLRAERAD
ncbi:MFS transporter [Micromonospora peucetia]|uniref:Drug resistance transporter, EmrB/QacA subfamily n=1 Tax=Micromonospora peucetia TaxID=47871 RepID=A0A1C6W495_9ACTN|nr:MFS transporter [Micromonospora peucetia]MCX4390221.1 MFS transporter [Micromonospora peucetia]WSA32470.1 MFS transporter [Micromonospora peucetia]SCL73336.1 drug resistance transporter, EmrB/QacA subfamily [Micromonospora peucetia]